MPSLSSLLRALRHLVSTGVVAAAALGATVPAFAQQAAEEIVVTGSRVARTGFSSPQPLTVINEQQIRDLGLVNVGEVARTIPQNTPFFTETNVGIGNFNVGAQLANLRGLNPFFGTRTLTLVDTKRVVPNSEGGAVDLTLIPSILVARTEVVTGGASAAYGSDAIAGVVNVILDKELQGIKFQLDGGDTFESDGSDYHAAFAAGTAFAGERGHALFGGEYQNQDQIGQCSRVREWCEEGWIVGNNAAFAAANGNPNFVVAPNGKFMTSDHGLFLPFGGPQQQFDESGTALLPYTPGQFPFSGFLNQVGGDGDVRAFDISNIRPDIERYALLGRVDWSFTDSLAGFVEAAYTHSESENFPANGSLGPNFVVIAPDNAFLSPAIQAVAPFGGLFSRALMPEVVSGRNTTENEIERVVVGLDGDLFSSEWDWDLYYQFGRNENHQRLFHNTVGSLFGCPPTPTYNFMCWALDAVFNPDTADPNDIACRATTSLNDPDGPGPLPPGPNPLAAGCVPLNLFGTGNADPAAIEYVFRTLMEDSVYKQHVIGANVRGPVFEGWAGPINAAAGVEWRKDKTDTTHDVPNQPWSTSYILSWGGDRAGDIEVIEGYAEVNAPLLKGAPLAQFLEVDLAVRRTRNSASSPVLGDQDRRHSFWAYKVAAVWDVADWLRFRGTYSRDVRAGGFRELFFPTLALPANPGGFPAGVMNPWNGNVQEGFLNLSGGNPDLAPEKADTTTVGIVLSPQGAIEGLRFSADWYEIDMKDAITPPLIGGIPAQLMVNACFESGGTAAICDKITGFGTADITQIDQRSLNLGSFLVRGLDFEASYGFDLNELSALKGNMNLRVLATYLYNMKIDTGLGTPVLDYSGQSGPVPSFGSFNTSPKWQGNLWLTYALERLSTTLEVRYVGPGSLNALWFESPPGDAANTEPMSVNDNSVSSRFYFTLSGSYRLPLGNDDWSVEVFAVANNIFDSDPPVAPGGNAYPTNPVFFDTIGAKFRAGVRVAF